MTHDQLVASCVEWMWNYHPEERRTFYAINNNSHNRIAGNKARALGVTAGVLDLCYILPGKCIYFDAKVGNDVLSKEQKDFIAKAEDRGCLCFTFSSLREFQQLIYELQNTYMI